MQIVFLFIRKDDDGMHDMDCAEQIEALRKRLAGGSRFGTPELLAVKLEDLTAKDYVESDPLDLDHLSDARRSLSP